VKFILTLVLCNYTVCTPPFEWPYKFNSYYECATTGYNAAILRLNDLGEDMVNSNRTTVLFTCQEIQDT
jgi:hypothetical protein|tara:strand:+ start:977 stop:1183 length:207 start_codon:yes stop_codon:yes gene_type:complete